MDISSAFRKNLLSTLRARGLAIILPLAAMPFLTRLFPPDAFAALALFGATTALIASFITLRFEWSLPNQQSEASRASVMALGLLSSVAFTIIISALVLMAVDDLTLSADKKILSASVWLLPIAVLVLGFRAMLDGWFVLRGDLRPVALATITQSVVNVLLSITLGLLVIEALGLIFASIAAACVALGVTMLHAKRSVIAAASLVTADSLQQSMLQNRAFVAWSIIVSILNSAAANVSVFLLGYLYAPQELASYAVLQRIAASPIAAFTSSLGHSFWSHAAKRARENQFERLYSDYVSLTGWLCVICVPVILLSALGPLYVGLLLGPSYGHEAGWVLAAMTPMFAANIIFSPTNHLVVFKKQRLQAIVDCIRICLIVAGAVIGNYYALSFSGTVFLMSVGGFFGHAIIFLLHRELAKR